MKHVLVGILIMMVSFFPFLKSEEGDWKWIAHGNASHKIYEKVRKYYVLPQDIVFDEVGIQVPIEGILFYVSHLHKDKRGINVLKRDIDVSPATTTQEKKLYRCRDCERAFPNPAELRYHECGSKRRKDREAEEREEGRHRREKERQKENWRDGSSYDRRRRHDIPRHDIPEHKIEVPSLWR